MLEDKSYSLSFNLVTKNQGERTMIKIYFDNVLIDVDSYSGLENDYKLFTDSFFLGSAECNTFKLSVSKSAVSSMPTDVRIEEDNNIYHLIADKIIEEKIFCF